MTTVSSAESACSRHPGIGSVNSALTAAGLRGGTVIDMSMSGADSRGIPAWFAEMIFSDTEHVFTVLFSALPRHGGSGMNEYMDKVLAYRTSMAMVKGMLNRGMITKEEYCEINRLLIKKYGLSLNTIFSETP